MRNATRFFDKLGVRRARRRPIGACAHRECERRLRLEKIADAQQRRDLLENAARGIASRRRDLMAGESGHVIEHVEPNLKATIHAVLCADACYAQELPLIARCQGRDARQRLRRWHGTRDDVRLCARPHGDKRSQPPFARGEVKEQVVVDRVRLPLNIGTNASAREKRVPIMVEVPDFSGDVVVEVFANDKSGGEAVANAGARVGARRVNRSIPVEPVTDASADLVRLGE